MIRKLLLLLFTACLAACVTTTTPVPVPVQGMNPPENMAGREVRVSLTTGQVLEFTVRQSTPEGLDGKWGLLRYEDIESIEIIDRHENRGDFAKEFGLGFLAQALAAVVGIMLAAMIASK